LHGATTALIIAFTRSIIDGPPYFSIASEKQVVVLALDNPFTDPVADGFLQGKASPPQGGPQGLPFAIHHQFHPVWYLPDPEREPRSTRQGQSLVVVLRSSCRCARREMPARR
jgi:hypothetical protein